jgi:DNA-binding XRE family transcriptional regulator
MTFRATLLPVKNLARTILIIPILFSCGHKRLLGMAYHGKWMKLALNVVGPQVQKYRNLKGWTQAVLAQKLQLQGWSVSLGSIGKLEAQLRRVPDCELLFLAKVLGVTANDLLPKRVLLKQIGPQFQAGKRLALFPTRGEK